MELSDSLESAPDLGIGSLFPPLYASSSPQVSPLSLECLRSNFHPLKHLAADLELTSKLPGKY